MIDLTPLDIRKKKADFHRGLRGYDQTEVEGFLDIVADRMEELVRENALLRERTAQLAETLNAFKGREQAMNEALVSAQQLREDIRMQSERDAELTLREARAEGDRLAGEARRAVEQERETLQRVQAQRIRFLRAYRSFLESQIGEITLEEERTSRARSGGRQAEKQDADAEG